MNRDWLVPIAVSLLSVAAGILLYRYTLHQPEYRSAPPVLETSSINGSQLSFEQISLPDLSGQPQALAQWDEPLLIVNFWAPWCAPCRREIPALIAAQKAYPEQIKIIGLSFDTPQNVDEFNAQHAINYPLLIVEQQATELNRFFGNRSGGLPFTAFLDQQREIVMRHAGEITEAQIESQIETFLNAK